MRKIEQYRDELRNRRSWNGFLLAECGLPGPRGNLELVAAVADIGDTPRFRELLKYTPAVARTGTAEEFLAVCGTVGLGASIAQGEEGLWPELRKLASDPRWRVREGVALALQRIGDHDLPALLEKLQSWESGNLLEQRAIVAGLCEPRLLADRDHALAVLRMLQRITMAMQREADRKSEAFRVLRQALGYGWSVAIVAAPSDGKRMFEALAQSSDRDIRWIVRENLKKQRLIRVDRSWTERLALATSIPSRPH
jgi:hypothetical protein